MQQTTIRLSRAALITALLILTLLGSALAAPAPQDAAGDGVLVVAVGEASPAAAAMIVRGDIILSVDGQAVNSVDGLTQAIQSRAPGDEVQLDLLHGDDIVTVTAVLGDNDGVAFLGIAPYDPNGDDAGSPNVMPIRPARPGHDAPDDGANGEAGEDADESAAPTQLRPLRPGATMPAPVQAPETETDDDAEPAETETPAEEAPGPEATPPAAEEPVTEPPADQAPTDETPVDEEATEAEATEDATAENDTAADSGVLVVDVMPGTPAEQAGIAPGDVIVAVEDQTVDGDNDLAALIGQYAPGDDVAVTIYDPAADDQMTLVVTLGENPNDETLPFLGVAYVPMDQVDQIQAPPAPEETPAPMPEDQDGAPEEEPAAEEPGEEDVFPPFPGEAIAGALIAEVVPDSPADEAGIRAGDLITAVDGQAVDAENDLAALIGQYAPGDDVELTLVDPLAGEEATIIVALGENPGDPALPFLGVRYMPAPAMMDGEMLPIPPLPPGRDGSADPEATPVPDEEPADMGETDEPAEKPADEQEEGDDAAAMPDGEEQSADDADAPIAVVIIDVLPDSPADRAGLQVHEAIVAVDGESFATAEDLAAAIGQYAPGDEVELTLADPMTGETRTATVALGENPETGGALLGIRYMPLPHPVGEPHHERGEGYHHGDGEHREYHRRHHGQPDAAPEMTPVPDEEAETEEPAAEAAPDEAEPTEAEPADGETPALGAVVAGVLPDSPADEAGVLRGDVIIAVDGEVLTAERDLASLIADAAPGDEVALTLWVPDSEDQMTLVVVLGENPTTGDAFLGVRYEMFELDDAMTDRPRPYQRERR